MGMKSYTAILARIAKKYILTILIHNSPNFHKSIQRIAHFLRFIRSRKKTGLDTKYLSVIVVVMRI